jgi:hypothetical protein
MPALAITLAMLALAIGLVTPTVKQYSRSLPLSTPVGDSCSRLLIVVQCLLRTRSRTSSTVEVRAAGLLLPVAWESSGIPSCGNSVATVRCLVDSCDV